MKEEILKEFDEYFIESNMWKSDDETQVFFTVESIRKFLFDKLEIAYQKGFSDGNKNRLVDNLVDN